MDSGVRHPPMTTKSAKLGHVGKGTLISFSKKLTYLLVIYSCAHLWGLRENGNDQANRAISTGKLSTHMLPFHNRPINVAFFPTALKG